MLQAQSNSHKPLPHSAPPPSPTLWLPPTGGEADAVSILELQSALPELALAFLHPGLLLAQLVDDDVELSFQDVNLPLSQLLLPASQQLLLVLLLERSPGQLLLPGTELLPRGTSREKSASQGMRHHRRERALSSWW